MSDLLLELYSEEIPPTLQEDAKSNISANFTSFFEKNGFKKVVSEIYSTPKRLIFYYSNLPTNIKTEAKVLRALAYWHLITYFGDVPFFYRATRAK